MDLTASNQLRPNRQSLALLTDFYELTMSYGYWKAGLDTQESVFHLFFRKSPFRGGYTIAAGLEAVIEYLKNFRFDASDLAYLESIRGADDKPLFESKFFDYLANMRFTCDIDAIPEGNVVSLMNRSSASKAPSSNVSSLKAPSSTSSIFLLSSLPKQHVCARLRAMIR